MNFSSLRSTCVHEKDKGPPLKQISSFVSWAQTRNKAIANTGCPNGWWVQSLWSTLAWAHRLQPDNSLIPPGPCLRESLSRKYVLQDICRDVDLCICLWLLQIGCHNSKHWCAPEEWGILHCKIVYWNFKTVFRLLDFFFFFSMRCWFGFSLSCVSTKVWLLFTLWRWLVELPGRWTLYPDKMSNDLALSSSWSANSLHLCGTSVLVVAAGAGATAFQFSKLSFLQFLMR